MSRRFPTAAALAAALFIAAAGGPVAAATPGKVALSYGVYLGGFEMIELSFDIGLTRDRYDMEMRFRPTSWLGRMFAWTMKAHSRGRLQGSRIRPERAGYENTWSGNRRWVALRYENGRTIVAGADPKPAASGPLKVPESLRRNTYDLVAAILSISATADGSRPCVGKVPVYDGRRRYNLHVTPIGKDTLERSRYSAFGGPAFSCRIVMERLKGFKKPKSFPQLNEESALHVWIGRPFPDSPPVPVRFELDSPYGGLRVHLAAARQTIGSRIRSLSALQ